MEIHRLGSYIRTLILPRSPWQRDLDTLAAGLITPTVGNDKCARRSSPGERQPGETAQQQGGAGHYGGTAGLAL